MSARRALSIFTLGCVHLVQHQNKKTDRQTNKPHFCDWTLASGPGEVFGSCSRKWETMKCPEEIDALKTVIQWVYNRYTKRYPSAGVTEPPELIYCIL